MAETKTRNFMDKVSTAVDEKISKPILQNTAKVINKGVDVVEAHSKVKKEMMGGLPQDGNARNIIYGFSTVFAFRSNDPETRKYASELFGKNIVLEQFKYSYKGFDLLQKEKEEFHIHDGNVVEDWDLTNLAVGEAIVGLTSEKPFRFKFDMYN